MTATQNSRSKYAELITDMKSIVLVVVDDMRNKNIETTSGNVVDHVQLFLKDTSDNRFDKASISYAMSYLVEDRTLLFDSFMCMYNPTSKAAPELSKHSF